MIHFIDIIIHILPEIFMAFITLICGLMYKLILHLKKQIELSHSIQQYTIKNIIINVYKKVIEQGYCSVDDRSNCVEGYTRYKELGGNGGMEKIMEEIHGLPTLKKEE